MKKKLAFLVLLLSFSPFIIFQVIFTVPEKPRLILQNGQEWQENIQCHESQQTDILDSDGRIDMLVWNIYKQNRENLFQELSRYSEQNQLLLLQEASLTEELRQWLGEQNWSTSLVRAFDAFEVSAGVVSLSAMLPEKACAYTETEPFLQLPKSALYTRYPLSNGEKLAVINLHAINFTIGTEVYRQQLKALKTTVTDHKGPVILAGDFNTWSEERLAELERIRLELNLTEVVFSPDERTRFINGLPLDHIFYKKLTLINAKAPETDASDHNPLIASFRIGQ